MHAKNAHCSYCGSAYGPEQPWPLVCAPCGNVTYRNPLPVAVTLVPVDDGVLCVRRTIPPGIGKIALPGGFMEVGESWREACARELREETGIDIPAAEFSLFDVHTAPQGFLLVFGVAERRTWADLPAFVANDEVGETLVVAEAVELAFPLHTRAMADWFTRRISP